MLELLVTIGVMTALAGLLLPAIHQARETARHLQCTNNLKQLGIALHNFENTHKTFPAGSPQPFSGGSGYLSPQAQLLGYVEQGNVQQLMDFNKGPFDSPNYEVASSKPSMFLCPTDPQRGQQTDMGWTSYHANCGSWVGVNGWDGVFGPNYEEEGYELGRSKVGLDRRKLLLPCPPGFVSLWADGVDPILGQEQGDCDEHCRRTSSRVQDDPRNPTVSQSQPRPGAVFSAQPRQVEGEASCRPGEAEASAAVGRGTRRIARSLEGAVRVGGGSSRGGGGDGRATEERTGTGSRADRRN